MRLFFPFFFLSLFGKRFVVLSCSLLLLHILKCIHIFSFVSDHCDVRRYIINTHCSLWTHFYAFITKKKKESWSFDLFFFHQWLNLKIGLEISSNFTRTKKKSLNFSGVKRRIIEIVCSMSIVQSIGLRCIDFWCVINKMPSSVGSVGNWMMDYIQMINNNDRCFIGYCLKTR